MVRDECSERADDSRSNPLVEPVTIESPTVTLDDIAGMAMVVDPFREIVAERGASRELQRAFDVAAGVGVLLYGPAGCSAGHFASALAGELEVALVTIRVGDALDQWSGGGQAAWPSDAASGERPAVVLVRGVEKLRAHPGRADPCDLAGVVAGFVAAIESTVASGQVVVGTTTRPWHLDPALARPGRFERGVLVPPPDPPARTAILEHLLAGRPVADGVDLEPVVAATSQFAGSDLAAVVDHAIREALSRSLECGIVQPVTQRQLVHAVSCVLPDPPRWFRTARTRAAFATDMRWWDTATSVGSAR